MLDESLDDVRARAAALQTENQRLAEQVKRLVRTEHGLYQLQEQLDNQIRIYRQLYEIGKQLNATMDVAELLRIATAFVLYQLNFERCVALLYDGARRVFRVTTSDGYYDTAAQAQVGHLQLPADHPALAPLGTGAEQLMCPLDGAAEPVRALGAGLGMAEYVAFALGTDPQQPIGLLIAGNTRDQAPYHTPVQADSEYVVGLANLVAQVATTIRMSREVQAREERLKQEVRGRERIEQELRVAQLIQRTLLPQAAPEIAGWRIARYYQPARAIGGDFYDFLPLPDGRLGVIVGDVSGKGIPAALVMASTRSVLRAVAQRHAAPGQVLAEVNQLLCPDVPAHVFVTCFYAILDPSTGRLDYANAGHNLPYRRHAGVAVELRATGMPLGLLPGMQYEERASVIGPGDLVLFHSDGLIEAHDPARALFGVPRLQGLVSSHRGSGAELIPDLLAELTRFVGADWEQEDDITLVTLER